MEGNLDNEGNSRNFPEGTYPYISATEYASVVNQWLWQCYQWKCFTLAYPYYLGLSSGCPTSDLNRNILPSAYAPNQQMNISPFNVPANRTTMELQGRDYTVPPLWKRFTAEIIDFFILLILKVIITYIAVDFFDVINLDKYDFDLLKNDKMDYHKAMEVTSEIITLEVIHRFVVCLFEATCIHKGIVAGRGGATPGKNVMKLRVVSCQSALLLDNNRVRIYPAGDLGFGWALLRAFIKNFSLAFVFPICFTMFFFQHNRTAYDIICNSIVVEEDMQYLQRRA